MPVYGVVVRMDAGLARVATAGILRATDPNFRSATAGHTLTWLGEKYNWEDSSYKVERFTTLLTI